MTGKKILVAMSGGVDSSVAAYLLKEQGHKVAGVTMCLGVRPYDSTVPACCGPQAVEDARKVAAQLEISHIMMDFSKELERFVVQPFVFEYLRGKTPNPCVLCNQHLKFGKLMEFARVSGFDYLATGHFARIMLTGNDYGLYRPRDREKDQTYFLYRIRRDNLARVLFPLADLTKQQVRQVAREAKLVVHDKPQSQDICFLPQGEYRTLVRHHLGQAQPGPIIDQAGQVLGEHRGIYSFTVGQRKGLGLGGPDTWYVTALLPAKNTVVVGHKHDLLARGLRADRTIFLVDQLNGPSRVRVRYSQDDFPCQVELGDETMHLTFNQAEPFVTPGQSAVLYRGERVLGGGIITEVER